MSIGCVVLAAGRGSRFGAPKSGAELRPGWRFLDAVVATAHAAAIEAIVVVAAPGTASPPGTVLVSATAAGQQIDSLRAGLRALPPGTKSALAWPVDHPFVTAATVQQLIAAAAHHAGAVVPRWNGRRGHPVLFARESWRLIEQPQPEGARSVLQALGRLVEEVDVPDRGIVADIDTPRDLEAARATFGG